MTLWKKLATLRASTKGVAFIEFAVALPVVVMISLMGIELVNLVLTHLRVTNIAMMTADNASRIRDSIDEADVAELLTGAYKTGENIDFTERGRVILSSVEANEEGSRQWVRWQRCLGMHPIDTAFEKPMTDKGAVIKDGTEIYGPDRHTPSTTSSSSAMSTATAIGPANNKIAAPPGTAIMIAEAVYKYKRIVPIPFFNDMEIRYTSAFNARQRANQLLRNANRIQPYSCNRFTET
jgi:hypothetical protein